MTSPPRSTHPAPVLRPRTAASGVVLVGYVCVAVLHLVAQLAGWDTTANWTQWLLMPLLAAYLLSTTRAPRQRLVHLTLVALGLSWLGDTAPDLASGDTAFLLMVGFFLLAQLVYIAAFWPYRADNAWVRRRWPAFAIVGAVIVLVVLCAPNAGSLLIPVLAYGLALGTMAILSTGVNTWVALGGALFLLSDGLIAIGAFASFDMPGGGFWVMLTYVAAQSLIVLGVLHEAENAAG